MLKVGGTIFHEESSNTATYNLAELLWDPTIRNAQGLSDQPKARIEPWIEDWTVSARWPAERRAVSFGGRTQWEEQDMEVVERSGHTGEA